MREREERDRKTERVTERHITRERDGEGERGGKERER